MLEQGRSQRRRFEFVVRCRVGILVLGLTASAATGLAQNADQTETKQTDNKVWTSESHNDPDVARERALQRYHRQNPTFPRRVAGLVRLPSGGVPYPPVEVFVCGQPAGSTDKKGRFNVAAPPRRTSGFSQRCRLSIQYPGTKPLSIALRPASNSRLGVLVLQPLPGYEGAFTSATTREASKPALRAYLKGAREEAKPKPNLEKAIAHFEEAVRLHPQFAEALTALGRVRLAAGDVDGAALAFETSIAADEEFPPPYRMLLRIRMQRGDIAPAAVISAALLRLNPGDDEARFYHALATFGLQRYDEAEISARSLIEKGAGERFPQTFLILGEICSGRGEVTEAARYFRSYLELAPDAASAPRIGQRLREWENAGLISPRDPGAVPADGQQSDEARKLLSQGPGF